MSSAHQGEGFPIFHTFTALEWRLTEVFRRMWLIPEAMLLEDEVERLHHLGNVGRGAGIPVSPGRPIGRRTPGGRKRVAELDPGAGGC